MDDDGWPMTRPRSGVDHRSSASFLRSEATMRKLQVYINKYGPEAGPKLYHVLQSQSAHAGVSARLRRKIEALKTPRPEPELPLFPEPVAVRDEAPNVASE